MNTFNKMTVGVFLSVLALASSAPARTTEASGVTLPEISVTTAEVSKLIATEMKDLMRKALSAPRPVRVRQSPSVSVYEPIDSMLVTASRLPALDAMETVVVTATRLPIETVVVVAARLPIETIVVAASRLPDPIEVATVRTAQVRL